MSEYRYDAIDQTGKRRRGIMAAENLQVLERRLFVQGLDLITARPARQPLWQLHRIDKKQHILFCLQLSQLLQAGVPILQALSELAEHTEHMQFASVLQQLQAEVESGLLLSQAMQAQSGVFSPFMAHLVAAAEMSGRLPEILQQLAHILQWQANWRSQILQGLLYPGLLAVVVLAAAVMMLTVLVPQMASFLQSLGQDLPWSTRVLLALSAAVSQYGAWMLLLLSLMITGVLGAIKRSPHWALRVNACSLRLPLLGNIIHKWILGSLCRMLGLLYQSGIPLLQALALCQPMLKQPLAQQALQQAQQQLEAGKSLAESFASHAWFPPLLVRMVRTGEQTGALDKTLSQLSVWYEQEVQSQMQWMLRMLEPLLTVVLGLLLLLLMAAVILPVYDSFNGLGQTHG